MGTGPTFGGGEWAATQHQQQHWIANKKALPDLKVLLRGQDHLQLLINLLADARFHVAHGGQVAKGDAHFRAHLLTMHFTENIQALTVGLNGFVNVSCHGVHLAQLMKSADQVAWKWVNAMNGELRIATTCWSQIVNIYYSHAALLSTCADTDSEAGHMGLLFTF